MNILVKYKWLIIIVTIVGLGASLIFSLVKPVYYDTSLSFAINRINRQETTQYQYDGYYSIQASDLFSQTVMSWLMTPSVLLEIYDQAKIDPKISSLEELAARFKTKQYSPQNLVVRFKERDQITSEKISQAIISVVESRAAAANQTSDNKALFQVVGAKPVIVQRQAVVWLNTLLGFLAGLLISCITAYIIEYLRSGQPKTEATR